MEIYSSVMYCRLYINTCSYNYMGLKPKQVSLPFYSTYVVPTDTLSSRRMHNFCNSHMIRWWSHMTKVCSWCALITKEWEVRVCGNTIIVEKYNLIIIRTRLSDHRNIILWVWSTTHIMYFLRYNVLYHVTFTTCSMSCRSHMGVISPDPFIIGTQ